MRRVTHSLVKELSSVPAFSSLDERTLLRIVGASVNLFWKQGSTIFREGDPAAGLYLVLSGMVRVGRDEADGTMTGRGAYFGDTALLSHEIHQASAVAVQDTELLVIPAESFEQLLESNAELAQHFRP